MDTPMMKKLVEDGRGFIPSLEAGVIVPDRRDQLGNETLFSYLVGIPEGHGGGVCMVCLSMSLYTVAQITFRNVNVSSNTAVIGGDAPIRVRRTEKTTMLCDRGIFPSYDRSVLESRKCIRLLSACLWIHVLSEV